MACPESRLANTIAILPMPKTRLLWLCLQGLIRPSKQVNPAFSEAKGPPALEITLNIHTLEKKKPVTLT